MPQPLGPETFGCMPNGTPVARIVLQTEAVRVALITFGAAIQSLEVAGPGGWTNVVLGLPTLEDYVARSPHLGAVPGRYAGRIAHGRFMLDGVEHVLERNSLGHTLHGGQVGFGKRPWVLAEHGPTRARMGLLSPDGDAGFPGELQVEVEYSVDAGDVRIDYRAVTSRPTVLNVTNHSYFNLSGEGSGSVLGHRLTMDADHFTPIDADSIPTGEVRHVGGSPFDFRTAHALGERIRSADPQIVLARGYDHAFLLNGAGLRRAALLHDPASNRTLEVVTTEPAVQLYTANKLDGALSGLSGRTYRQADAVCLETQHLADSPNQTGFPSTVLRPGDVFASTTIFRFGTA